jgi:hypothetical protein
VLATTLAGGRHALAQSRFETYASDRIGSRPRIRNNHVAPHKLQGLHGLAANIGEAMSQGIVVIIASVRRPLELGRWVDHVRNQSVMPLEMIWAVTGDGDLPEEFRDGATRLPAGLTIVRSPVGLTTQRNRGLAAIVTDPSYIVFFDDDYVPTVSCLGDIIRSFEAIPDAVGLTGTLLADGIKSPGIAYEDAAALIAAHTTTIPPVSIGFQPSFEPWDGLYGCNMAFRADAIAGARFDENLPLYGWQEDVDFAVRVRGPWQMGRTDGFVGVHQGVKGGRTSGKRIGYSQVANPCYLVRKGSMKWRKALIMATKNVIANHALSLRPESWIDRRGRVVGNWLAIADIALGRSDPMRILEL